LINNGLSNSWKALEYACYGIETSSIIRENKDKPGTIEGGFPPPNRKIIENPGK
jgi:hypothetical protein